MTSFAKFGAVLGSGFLILAVWLARADDPKPSKAGAKGATPPANKSQVAAAEETPPPRKTDVPVIKGHPAIDMRIPYFSTDGKRQMNFKIAMATRIDDNHVNLKNMQIETFDTDGKHEMDVDLPDSLLDTDTSIITTKHHAKISRDDFEITGDAMIFNTHTKQGGLSGNVHMIIYDLKSKTGQTPDGASTPEPTKN